MLRLAKQEELIRKKREEAISIVVGCDSVVLKDQRPLVFANVALSPGWSAEDLIAHLNQHVYFWPGGLNGCVKTGVRFLNHYMGRQPAILRIPTKDLLDANHVQEPLFCPFNSGAPRMQAGVRVPRGPDLFQSAGQFPRTAGKVIELVFRSTVRLPDATELTESCGGWSNLWAAVD
jgi:hypothetical protein